MILDRVGGVFALLFYSLMRFQENLGTGFRNWLLRSFGWVVVTVPLEDFKFLQERSHAVREQYLSRRLREAAPLLQTATSRPRLLNAATS